MGRWRSSTRKKGRRKRRNTQRWTRTLGTVGPILSPRPTPFVHDVFVSGALIKLLPLKQEAGARLLMLSFIHSFIGVETLPELSPR